MGSVLLFVFRQCQAHLLLGTSPRPDLYSALHELKLHSFILFSPFHFCLHYCSSPFALRLNIHNLPLTSLLFLAPSLSHLHWFCFSLIFYFYFFHSLVMSHQTLPYETLQKNSFIWTASTMDRCILRENSKSEFMHFLNKYKMYRLLLSSIIVLILHT